MTIRRGLRSSATAVLCLLAVACRGDRAAWRAQLADPGVRRMEGSWQLELVLARATTDSAMRPAATGRIALTLNEAGVDASGLGSKPHYFGTYDIDFAPLRFSPGESAGVPAVIVLVVGDSVFLKLAPESLLPVELRGRFAGDSVLGLWSAHERAPAGARGEFILRRR